jgi:uncharacterized Zn-binding protein involved in type VI secretion
MADPPAAARKTDTTVHGGAINVAVAPSNVWINGRPAARLRDRHRCPKHIGGAINEGSESVLINGRKAARTGDHLLCALPDAEAMKLILAAWNDLVKHPSKAGLAAWQSATGVDPNLNPYAGMNKDLMLAAYKAGVESGTPPEDVLALATKEGVNDQIANRLSNGIPVEASSAAEARSIGRSELFYVDMGMDHFTSYTTHPNSDNTLNYDAAKNDTAFSDSLKTQYGEDAPAVANSINDQLAVTPTGAPGVFNVKPTGDFYANSLAVGSDRFTDVGQSTFSGLGGEAPTTDLNYMQWNMGKGSFEQYLKNHGQGSAEATDQEALHTNARSGSWAQARRNAIRFGYFRKAFALLYEELMQQTMAQMDVIFSGSDDVGIGK